MKTLTVEVDNGIYEVLRLELVAAGYLPDKLAFLPNNLAGYEAAKVAIRNAGKPVIELYNSSAYDSRNELTDPVIVIDRILVEPADAGMTQDWEYKYNQVDGDYDKYLSPDTRYDITYQITYITKLEETASIIESILAGALGARKYIPALKSSDNSIVSNFYLHRLNYFDTSGSDFLERGCRYLAKYIDIAGSVPLGKVAAFDFTKFTLDVSPVSRETLFKKIVEIFDVNGLVTGYDDIYKLGLSVVQDQQGNEYVEGPDGELYSVNPNDGTIEYLTPNL